MSYLRLVWKNAARNKRRTILTAFSVALSIFVLSSLLALMGDVDRRLRESDPLRLITHHAVSQVQPLPERYLSQIREIDGVSAVTPLTWFFGTYIDSAHTNFMQFSVDPETFFDVYSEMKLPPEQRLAFSQDRTGVIVGRPVAEKHGWKIGDRITLKGMMPPVDLELAVRGVYSSVPSRESAVYFHREYVEEAAGRPGVVSLYWVRADSPAAASSVSETVDSQFQNTSAPTKTENERAFLMGFISMIGNLRTLILAVSGAVIFTILLITANTIAMSVRERVGEIAILKALGFGRRKILALLASEAVVITLSGGVVGTLVARLVFTYVNIASLSQNVFQSLEVDWGTIALGLLASTLVGLISASVPAYLSVRMKVADALRHVR